MMTRKMQALTVELLLEKLPEILLESLLREFHG